MSKNHPANKSPKAALAALKNPVVQRLLIWLAPIVLRFIVKQFTGKRSASASRKYVKNKAK